jgi:hypothetical protein
MGLTCKNLPPVMLLRFRRDINKIVSGNYSDDNRDFSKYLNAWQQIENKLEKM